MNRLNIPKHLVVIGAACLMGLVIGSCAQLLKYCVMWVSDITYALVSPDGANLWFLFTPAIGFILALAYQRYVIHSDIEHGVSRMRSILHSGGSYLPANQIWSPVITSAFTLGFGGSAGTEGPIATTGGAVGSWLGRRFRFPPQIAQALLAIGAGAGIAGIFKAPVGGMLFSIEVLGMGMTALQLTTLATACTVSALTAYVLSGLTTDVVFPDFTPVSLELLPWALLLGIFCGIYSIYYNRLLDLTGKVLSRVSSHWLKAVGAGLTVGVLILLFPHLYGEGYSFISRILAGDWGALARYSPFASLHITPWLLIAIAAGVLMVKSAAVSCTTSGGGVAGEFAPAIFAGAIAGFLFALTVNTVFGLHLPVGDLAFFGMAAVLGATQRAPLMAMFLVTEMVQHFSLLLPVVVATAVAYLVYRFLDASRK